MSSSSRLKRGRPPKFGRPSEVVALTLPSEVVRGLRRMNSDLAWAIVRLFERKLSAQGTSQPMNVRDTELVSIAPGMSLIVVKPENVRNLPGLQTIPLGDSRAFLALEDRKGMADLELAVIDRLEDRRVPHAEMMALRHLRDELRAWRRNPALRFHTRAIIVAEHVKKGRRGRKASAGK